MLKSKKKRERYTKWEGVDLTLAAKLDILVAIKWFLLGLWGWGNNFVQG